MTDKTSLTRSILGNITILTDTEVQKNLVIFM